MSAYKTGMFCWNEIGTRNVAAARTFYTKLFGWGTKEVPMPGDSGTYTLFQIDGKDIAGLYEMQGPQFEGVPPHWMVYVWADDVDAAAAAVKRLGGKIHAEPMDIPGVGRMAVAQDPTGAVFSLFRGTEHAGAAQFGPRAGTFCWRELVTRNTDQAGSFYTQLFNWGIKPSPGYTEFLIGGTPMAGMIAPAPEWGEIPAHWGLYVQVDDCNATVKKAESLGARALVPPTDIARVGRFSLIGDPSGASISVITLTGVS